MVIGKSTAFIKVLIKVHLSVISCILEYNSIFRNLFYYSIQFNKLLANK